jgi:hypothetical protein
MDKRRHGEMTKMIVQVGVAWKTKSPISNSVHPERPLLQNVELDRVEKHVGVSLGNSS